MFQRFVFVKPIGFKINRNLLSMISDKHNLFGIHLINNLINKKSY